MGDAGTDELLMTMGLCSRVTLRQVLCEIKDGWKRCCSELLYSIGVLYERTETKCLMKICCLGVCVFLLKNK